MVDLANTVWRDFATAGIPASGANNPKKSKIREWGSYIESLTQAANYGNTVWFATKSALDGDLAHDAGTPAIVYADTTAANNGIYIKAGASGAGSWGQIITYLPGYQFVTATDAGAGTANAIVATSSPRVAYTDGVQLIRLNIYETNTATSVTVAFDGGAALAVKTVSGANPAIGGLTGGMTVIGVVDGSATQFRLISELSNQANFDHQGEWSSIVTYTENQVVTGSDGYWYQLKTASALNDNPVSGGSGDWLQILASTGIADGAVTEPKLADSLGLKLSQSVATRTAMLALDTTRWNTTWLKEAGREGVFGWDGSDLSATVLGSAVASSAVDSATETITSTAHGLVTGDAVVATSAVNGLSTNTLYYVIKVDANNFKLASSHANALAGTAFDLTGTTATTVKRHNDPEQVIYVYQTADITGASGAWVRSRGEDFEMSWSGFSTAATAANNAKYANATITLVNALGGGVIKIREGTFAVNTILMKANVTIQGANRAASILADARADSNSVITSSDNSASMLWAKVLDLKITKANATGGTVIDMTSWQYCEVGRCWITAASVAGTECVRMRGLYTAGPVFTTEGTYNHVHSNYIGLTAFGIRLGPNANTCWIKHNRIQPSFTGGTAIYLGTTGAGETAVAGFPNQVIISENSVEFPSGAGVTGLKGVYIENDARTVIVTKNRFEGGAIDYGVYAEAGATGYSGENYFESIATLNTFGISSTFVTQDATEGPQLVPTGKMAIVGTTGAKKGTAHNLTASRSGAGTYVFTFSSAMTDGNYSVSISFVSSTAGLTTRLSAKSNTAFTVVTETHLGTATDVLDVSVLVFP